uniref:Uncharacterized protein n=1 Tax=Fusarium oxysporum (strain Fo5176) TaxID=660025 RepID=A0A0D2XM92_FUSOF
MALRLQTIDNNLKGRLALVTGSSGGIGSAVARAFAAQGCDVGLHYSSSKEKADKLAQELSRTYPSQLFVPVHADLSQRESTRALVSSLLSQDVVSSKHKAVSILVANAGLGRRIRDVAEIGEDDWDEMMEVNSRSHSMGQNLATLLAPEGVTVNIVSPAMIGSTGMIPPPISETWDKGCNLEELKKTDPGLAIAASIPVHRLGSPNEVCEAIIIVTPID